LILSLILLLWIPAVLFAQPAPDTLWTRVIGGTGDDLPSAIRQTSDGGFIVVGTTNSSGAGGWDVSLVKLDAAGNVQWSRSYGTRHDDFGWDVRERPGGGFVVQCAFRSEDNTLDRASVLKTTAAGDSLQLQLCGQYLRQAYGGLVTLPDSGVLVALVVDSTSHDLSGQACITTRLTADGQISWTFVEQNIISTNHIYTTQHSDIEPAADGGAFLSGTRDIGALSPRWLDHYVLTRRYSAADNGLGGFFYQSGGMNGHVAATRDGGALCQNDWTVRRLDANGAQRWSAPLPLNTADFREGFRTGYVVATTVNGQADDVEMAGYDSTGVMIWRRICGGTGTDSPVALETTRDSGYVCLAQTRSFGAGGVDMYVIRTAPDRWVTLEMTMELIALGPPAWGYRITRTAGVSDSILMGPCCFGTTGTVTGAAAQYWTANGIRHSEGGDQVCFRRSAIMDGVVTLDTFWLHHPMCDGVVTWSSSQESGSLLGPFSEAADPIFIQVKSCAVTDSGVAVDLTTLREPHTASIELWRSVSDSLHFVRLATRAAAGGLHRGAHYRLIDSTVVPDSTYWYRFSSVDSFGWRRDYPQAEMHLVFTPPPSHIESLTGFYDESAEKIVVRYASVFEHGLVQHQVMRSENSEQDFVHLASHMSVSRSDDLRQYEYEDFSIESGRTYRYYVRTLDSSGVLHEHRYEMLTIVTPPAVLTYRLSAYPNPFNAEARVVFSLPERERATVDVFSIDGRKVATLTDGDWDAGRHEVVFDGATLSSGIYLLHLRSPHYTATQKLVLLK
jgi:hypothetical protein